MEKKSVSASALKNPYRSIPTKNHERNKRLYDMRVRNQIQEKSDHVLVHNLGITGKHKLQDRWNSLPHVVLAQLPNLPVYNVKPERGTGVVKTVHRDHLLPIGYLERMLVPSERKAQMSPPQTRAQKARMDNESQTQISEHLNQGARPQSLKRTADTTCLS